MGAARIIHEFLRWLLPALFGALAAIIGIALAASQTWEAAKNWTADRFLDAVAIVENPWAWGALIAMFVGWLLAFIWSGRAVERSQGTGPPPQPLKSPPDHVPLEEAATAPDFVALEEAGLWLYENGGSQLREALKGNVPGLFGSIAEHGAAFYKTQWAEGRCDVYGRWESGLPMELIDPKDGDFNAFESLFGSDRRQPIDLSVLRKDLRPVLDFYERDEPAREPVKVVRDTPLREALMYVATGVWGLKPMARGGDELGALERAVREFRQHALDRVVSVWGQTSSHSVWVPIDPDYWLNHQVAFLDLLRAETKTTKLNHRGADPLYTDLMVCRAEFEAEFPPNRPA